MNYIILLLLGLRPFICEQVSITSGLLFNFIFCLLLLVFFIVTKKIKIKPYLLILLFALPAWLFIAQAFSVNAYNSQKKVIEFCLFALTFIFVINQEKRHLRFLISAMIAVSIIVSLRALYQYFSGFSYIAENFSYTEIAGGGFYAVELLKQRRAVSWFSSPNLLASYLVMCCLLLAGCLFKNVQKKKQKRIILFSIIFGLLFAALITTKTIGAHLSLLIGLVFFGIIFHRKNKVQLKRKRWLVFLMLIICIFGGIFFKRIDYFLNFKNPENSVVQRAYYWHTAAEMIKERPWFGVGAGNFGIVYPRFKQSSANETNYAHNSYLQMWAESGIFFLIFFVVFVVYIFRRLLPQDKDPLSLGLLSGSFVFLVHNLVSYSFFISQVAHVWWIFTACALNLGTLNSSDTKVRVQKKNEKVLKFIYCFTILFLLLSLFSEYQAEDNLEKGMKSFKEKKFSQALLNTYISLGFSPKNDFGYYLLARCYQEKAKAKFSPLVVENYEKAIALSPEYAFYHYELGAYFMRYGKYKEAKRFLKQALRLYPTNKEFTSSLKKVPFENPI